MCPSLCGILFLSKCPWPIKGLFAAGYRDWPEQLGFIQDTTWKRSGSSRGLISFSFVSGFIILFLFPQR
ncbi:hypothetical protein XELAEV_18028552mg [Xenopus laevis]|uniref:Uncharacterized protein n=1 Tax=Xenopus laevis TaxID=8355 RepID=A0A974CRS8_XENLA|nr:hypothetical protein XELAEV_18028552mg [Xenopus laevis]